MACVGGFDTATGEPCVPGQESEPAGRASSEGSFVGYDNFDQEVWKVEDPDFSGGFGFFVKRQGSGGSFPVPATRDQVEQAEAYQSQFTGGGSGGGGAAPTKFTFRQTPGGGTIAINPVTLESFVVVPDSGGAPDQITLPNGNLGIVQGGKVTDTGQQIAQPTLSPQEIRADQLADFQLKQQAQIAATAQQQGFQAQESAAARGFTGQENALTRAQRAGEFAATHGLNQREQALGGAAQLSNLISNVDPAAFEAFAAGGGFNIANAIAGGGDALSTNALLPAARTLRALEQPFGAQGFAGQGGSAPAVDAPGTAMSNDLTQQQWFDRFRGELAAGQGIGAVPGSAAQSAIDQLNALGLGQSNQGGAGIQPFALNPQQGTTFPTGDAASAVGGATGPLAQLLAAQSRQPVISAAHGFNGIVNEPTTLQVGENGPEHVQVTPGSPAATPEDDPFLQRIRNIRE
ncbi:MAG TPA: hypothetical protein VFH61_12275, partial [Thermoleophilia bacterium]|nr:hypothetical protein [Thermoleophilia bacterium]